MPRPRKYKRPTNQTVTFEETELREIRRAAAATREPGSVFIRRLFLQALGGEADSSNGNRSSG